MTDAACLASSSSESGAMSALFGHVTVFANRLARRRPKNSGLRSSSKAAPNSRTYPRRFECQTTPPVVARPRGSVAAPRPCLVVVEVDHYPAEAADPGRGNGGGGLALDGHEFGHRRERLQPKELSASAMALLRPAAAC